MDQVEAICDRVGIMHGGELIAVDTVDALQARTETSATLIVSVESTPDDIGSRLTRIEGIENVTARNGTLRIACTDPTAKATTIARLNTAEATIEDVTTNETSLEQVFTSITGGRS
jgi:ABC-2 type transport system ATP-binding protein